MNALSVKRMTSGQPARKRAPGGGRKPLAAPDDPTERQDVTMPASYWAKARALGDGNASAGIRVALTRADTAAVSARPKL